MKKYGFIRIASVTPKTFIGNVEANTKEIKEIIKKVNKKGVEITLFPELTLTSVSANDLFFNTKLIDDAYKALIDLKKYTKKYKGIYVMDELRNIYSKEIPVEDKIRDGFEYLEKALK